MAGCATSHNHQDLTRGLLNHKAAIERNTANVQTVGASVIRLTEWIRGAKAEKAVARDVPVEPEAKVEGITVDFGCEACVPEDMTTSLSPIDPHSDECIEKSK